MLYGYWWHTLLYIYAPKGKEPGAKHRPPLLRAKRQTQVRIRPSLLFSLYQCRRLQEDCTVTGKEAARVHKKEIQELTKLADGGGLSTTLKTLEVSDFITLYIKYDYPKREVYYRLTDFYSKFYLSFIDGKKTTNPSFSAG